jgi:hypothetical protein
MKSLIGLLRRHRNLVLLLLTGLLVPLVAELSSSWLQARFGQTPSHLLQLFAIVTGIAVSLWVFYRVLGSAEAVELVPEEARPPRFPGLIVLVGTGKKGARPEGLSHNVAIEYHLDCEEAGGEALRVCWLIASAGEMGSVPIARAVRERYRDRCELVIREIKSAFDVEGAYDVIRQIYTKDATEYGLSTDQIIADFTGGTKPMSVGMALACRSRWPMQYTTGGREDIASVPVKVRFKRTR